jgi:hypothetical protein
MLESSSAIASFSFETSKHPPRYLSASRMTLDVRNLFLPAILMELPIISVDCDSKYASKPKLMITRLMISIIIYQDANPRDSAISYLAGQRSGPPCMI